MGCQIISCCGQSVLPSTLVTPSGSSDCTCDPSTITIYAGMYVANSITAVRAIATSANNKGCIYNGNLTNGDAGGSALYAWDSLSVVPDDGFSVLQPTDQLGDPATPGRFVQTPAP